MTGQVHLRGVDFHCHLDLYPDYRAAVARAESAEIYTVSVTTTPRAWAENKKSTQDTNYVHAALGLHPQLVGERGHELPLWEKHLSETRFIGEVGLDAGPRFYKSLSLQKHVFQTVLERCADAGGKLLTVHSVRSSPVVLDMIETFLPLGRGTVVLHWFTGTMREAQRAIGLGCYFSVNAAMTRTSKGQALVKKLPLSRILTETDGPFTMSDDQRPAEPGDTHEVVSAIAALRSAEPSDISTAIVSNLLALLGPSETLF